MPRANFVHLHTHTEYSLLDGTLSVLDLRGKPGPLLNQAYEYKMSALAMTDHGTLFGAIRFYKAAISAGIKPIIGCEMYVAPGSRFDRSARGISEASYHLTLLAKNEEGYKNLIRLVTAGYLEGFYYRPRVDKEILTQNSKGLIALSGCLSGEVARFLLQDDIERARTALDEYKNIFEKENFYIEIQDHGLAEQKKINPLLVELSKKDSIPLVATNDCHYLKKSDAYAQDVFLCIGTARKINEENRMKFSSNEFYFKSPREMEQLFKDIPEALINTVKIAEKCNLELHFDKIYLPQYTVDTKKKDVDLDKYLQKQCEEGLRIRYPEITQEIKKRLDYELEIISKMGYASYFLIVWDFIKYARQNNIPVGPGRGSGAGSLVAYSLKITNVDPMRYGLLFERFLNPERVSMPDLDIDFSDEGRESVINYVKEKYGHKNVAQIVTFGTLGARQVIRDVGRVLDVPLADTDKIAKLVPAEPGITLAMALGSSPELADLVRNDITVKKLYDVAVRLEGLTRHISKHAAGIVISKDDLTNYVPFCKNSKGDITTQYDGESLVKLGLLKVDFLGIRTLTVIQNTVNIVKRIKNINIDIENLALDDEKTYQLLSDAKSIGIFQLESGGMRDLLKKISPSILEDIIALVALYRPGPMGSGMLDDFVARKHGKKPVKYDHPLLEPLLKETYGIILYQEQVIQMAIIIAGFSPGQADLLRRAMGKKIPEEIEKQRHAFIEGAGKKGIKQAKAVKLFDLMAKFGGYGFNKSHSASYAFLAYQTAYLKANFPVEYMAALLTSEMGNTDKVALYISECQEMGIQILPPDVNQSRANFTVVDEGIRFGLAAVKNVGLGAIEAVIKARQSGGFTSLYDFCKRVDLRSVNRRVVESLIKCGAFDFLTQYRAVLFESLDETLEKAAGIQKDVLAGQGSFFDLIDKHIEHEDDGNGKNSVPVEEWPENKLLEYEKQALGFYVTGHPLAKYASQIKAYTTANTQELSGVSEGQQVRVGGIVNKVKHSSTKKGERMAMFELHDLEGSLPVVVFPSSYTPETTRYIHNDEMVIVSGQLNKRREYPQIILERIIPISQMRELLTSSIHIELKTAGLEEDVLDELRKTLGRHKGRCPVFLRFSTTHHGALAMKSTNLKVDPSDELIKDVEGLLGKDSIVFKGK
ncbi:MAG: DNA polymerase III subunit alpha [bacterium]